MQRTSCLKYYLCLKLPYPITFYVIENAKQSLLGRDIAIELKVLKLGLSADCVNSVEKIDPFPKIKDRTNKIPIDSSVKPFQNLLWRIPIALKGKVEEKIREAPTQDLIEPSSWLSSVVLVFKGNREIRLCVDMR